MITVIGDIGLDKYTFTSASKINPEAPTIVGSVLRTESRLGMCGNVANNINNLTDVSVISVIGEDDSIKDILNNKGIENTLIKDNRKTTTKHRIIANSQQIIRLDEEDTHNINNNITEKIKKTKSDIIILSDYNKGVLTQELCEEIITNNDNVLVDPKGSNWDKYNSVTLITPNIKEAEEFLGRKIPNEDKIAEIVVKDIKSRTAIDNVLLTRSEHGMTLLDENDNVFHFEAEAKEVFDVSGAGDTVISTIAVMLEEGKTMAEAVKIANKAASFVVNKIGTYAINKAELHEIMSDSKLLKIDNLIKMKQNNLKYCVVNGVFDLIHSSHISLLKEASNYGDKLIVCINSDSSVKRLKGESRPIRNEKQRAELLEQFDFVDYVCIFDEDTPEEIYKKLKPDVLVKGADYKLEDVPERKYVGEVVFFDLINKEQNSTSSIIKKVLS